MDEVIDQIKEWQKKAKLYDENARLITLFGWIQDTKTLTEIQEKAKKYDELFNAAGGDVKWREWYEKAKKYDEIKKLIESG